MLKWFEAHTRKYFPNLVRNSCCQQLAGCSRVQPKPLGFTDKEENIDLRQRKVLANKVTNEESYENNGIDSNAEWAIRAKHSFCLGYLQEIATSKQPAWPSDVLIL